MSKSSSKILGVIGDPISHSLSPLMHNAGLACLKLPYLYEAFLVKDYELGDFFKNLKKKHIVGLNVTIPHKQGVIPYMDSLSREARLIGAVNTILVKNKKLYGSNTDGMGYLLSLKKEAGFDVKGKQVILLGAGGAARALCVAFGLAKAREVFIINRTLKKAHDLAVEMSKKIPHTTYNAASFEHMDKNYWSFAD